MCSGICRYIWYSFWAKVFRFRIESWREWDSNPRPRAYRAHEYIYIVNLLFNLDFVLNWVASNGLQIAPLLKNFAPSMWKRVRRAWNSLVASQKKCLNRYGIYDSDLFKSLSHCGFFFLMKSNLATKLPPEM